MIFSRVCLTPKYLQIKNISVRNEMTVSVDVKGCIFFKNRHFIIKERFNKMIYGINTTIKCGT